MAGQLLDTIDGVPSSAKPYSNYIVSIKLVMVLPHVAACCRNLRDRDLVVDQRHVTEAHGFLSREGR